MLRSTCITLSIIPIIITALNIFITPSETDYESTIECVGVIQDTVSEEERIAFGITDDIVEELVNSEQYSKICPPNKDGVAPKKPYIVKSWRKVKRYLQIIEAKIMYNNILSNEHVSSMSFYNNDTEVIKLFNPTVQKAMKDVIRSKWSGIGNLTVTKDIGYEVYKDLLPIGGTTVRRVGKWRSEEMKMKYWNVEIDCDNVIPTKPGQGVLVRVSIALGLLQAKIHYTAFIDGEVEIENDLSATHYTGTCDQEISVKNVMEFNGLNNSVNWTETLELEYFFKPTIVARDNKTNEVLSKSFIHLVPLKI